MRPAPCHWLLLAFVGCAYPRAPHGAGGVPEAHTFQVVALSAEGAAAVEERRVSSPGGTRRWFHVSAPDGRVTTVPFETCRTEDRCHAQGLRLESWGLSAKDGFRAGAGAIPQTYPFVLPEVGAFEVQLSPGVGPHRTRGLALVLRRPGGVPLEVWHLPGSAHAEATLYRAGRWLFVELGWPGGGLERTVRAVDLHARAADLLALEGQAAVFGRRPQQAEALTRAGLGLVPEHARLRYLLACALAQQGLGDAAMVELSYALGRDPRLLPSEARRDEQLAPLRDREDFRALVAPAGLQARP